MSKLDDLIAELCPDGVEYKKLIDVAMIRYGYPFDAQNFTDNPENIPIIRIRDILPAKAGTYYKGPIIPEYIIKKGDILIGMDGNFNLARWNDRDALLNQRVCKISSIDETIVLNGYLYHLLGPIFKIIERSIHQSTVKHLSAKLIHGIEIPLPPLPVQCEIVRILDTFTELTEELTERRKQYEYYRDKLLTFTDGVKYKPLSEITHLTAGDRITKSMMRDDFEYPVMSSGAKPSGKYTNYNYSHSIAIPRVGAAGLVNWMENEFWATDDCFVCSKKCEEVDIKYIYYFLKTKQVALQSKIYGGTFPKLKKDYLWSLPIPIPPLKTQNKIVSILDRFDALCNDLTQGIPAEIEARRKQYEYYRDKLLTFKHKKESMKLSAPTA